jgi:acyl carrier protein
MENEQQEIRAKFMTVIRPFVRNLTVEEITDETLLIEDLRVNSARLVDIILEMEDQFQIRIEDDEAESLTSVGRAIGLICSKKRVAA